MATAKSTGSGDGIKVTAKVAAAALPFLAARLDQAMPVGNEGAGTVIKAGSSEAAQALLGQDGVDGRRRDVCAVSAPEGDRLPAAAGRHDARPRAPRGSSTR